MIMDGLSDKQSLLLSQFSYLNLNEQGESPETALERYKEAGATLADIANKILERAEIEQWGGITDTEYRDILNEIANDSEVGSLVLKDYQNNNASGGSGFVGYAFSDGADSYFAFRGTEGSQVGAGTVDSFLGYFGKDWIDNYNLGINGISSQFADVENFVKNNMIEGGSSFVTGHSKGGANALYAAAAIEGVQGIAFDAPGIDQALTQEQRNNLAASGISNYVAAGDPVGALLFHSENRIFVEQGAVYDENGNEITSLTAGHFTQALSFDESGNVLQAARTVESLIVENASKAIWFSLNFITDTQGVFIQQLSELGLADDVGDFINGMSKTVTDIKSYLQNSINNEMNEFLNTLGDRVETLYKEFATLIISKNPFAPLPIDLFRSLFTTASSVAVPRRDPLILDLDGDGTETIGVESGAYFDHDANGFAEQTGWVSGDDGLLVRDIDGNGTIDSGKELFGDQTILSNGTKASNGFQALSELDENKDGKIDAQDAAFNQLKVWQDIDGDGYSSADELISLSDAGVASINTGYTNTNTTDAEGNTIKQTGSFTRTDGSEGNASDVWFKTDNMYTIANEWLDVPEDIAALPDLQGYGNVVKNHAIPPLSFLTGDRDTGVLV